MNRRQDVTLAVYAHALRDASPSRVIGLLDPAASFTSPFSSWTAAADVHAAYEARALAVTDVNITASVARDDIGVLIWCGRIGQRTCEGVEVIVLTPNGAIVSVDVFLRPAGVLDDVRAAMAAAWPSTPNVPA